MQVAKVTVNDETLIVHSEHVQRAIEVLAGGDTHDAEICVEHGEMSKQEFDAIPEYQ